MDETTFEIEVQDDHVEKVSQTRKPILALSELIWNALDADAERVDVTVEHDDLGGIRAVEVGDNGHGIPHGQAEALFGKLGGSWKRARRYTKEKNRLLHGQEGKGRLRSFSLGRVVDWTVRYEADDGLREYTISIIKDQPRRGRISPEAAAQPAHHRGTIVRITEILGNFRSLSREEAPEQIAVHFALYLRQYPSVQIYYNGERVDPRSVEDRSEIKPLPDIESADGKTYPCELEIVEWKIKTERRLFLCNAHGFPLDETAPGIQAPGFQFTAYLKSEYFAELMAANALDLAGMDTAVEAAITAAKAAMRDHFRSRAEEQARGLVEQWKQEKIYPYENEPATEVERKERQVFDITALNVATYLPKFQDSEPKAKQLQLRLLRHAIETGPEEALRFLTEVLDLPPERRQDLAALLDRTTLSEIIRAAKLITDRLEFLQGLQDRAKGILYQSDDAPIITIWVRTWAEIVEDAQARMRFFQERLGYTPDRDASLEHLRNTYSKHVGELIAAKDAS